MCTPSRHVIPQGLTGTRTQSHIFWCMHMSRGRGPPSPVLHEALAVLGAYYVVVVGGIVALREWVGGWGRSFRIQDRARRAPENTLLPAGGGPTFQKSSSVSSPSTTPPPPAWTFVRRRRESGGWREVLQVAPPPRTRRVQRITAFVVLPPAPLCEDPEHEAGPSADEAHEGLMA